MWQLYGLTQIFWPARKNVEKAWAKKDAFHASGEYIYFEDMGPWKEHLNDIESENNKEGIIKFAFYQDDRKMFRIQTIAPKDNGFGMRVPIAKAWRGLRSSDFKQLDQESGFQDIEFVHASGFIGGAWSLETAIRMADQSLAEHKAECEAKAAQQK